MSGHISPHLSFFTSKQKKTMVETCKQTSLWIPRKENVVSKRETKSHIQSVKNTKTIRYLFQNIKKK